MKRLLRICTVSAFPIFYFIATLPSGQVLYSPTFTKYDECANAELKFVEFFHPVTPTSLCINSKLACQDTLDSNCLPGEDDPNPLAPTPLPTVTPGG